MRARPVGIAGCCLLLVAFIAGAGASTPPPPTAVGQVPLSPDALHACTAGELKKALVGAFRMSKRFRYIPDLDDAPIKLEILECTRLERITQTLTSTARPIKIPVGGGAGFGGEEDAALQTDTARLVRLRARIAAGTRFVNIESDAKDERLKVAAESIRREIEKALTDHGEWLSGRSGP
jgi:hypothetical protein